MSDVNLKKLTSLGYTPAPNEGSLWYDSVKGCFVWVDENNLAWYFGEQRCVLTADLTGSTSTTLADVTGLVFPLRINTRYKFEFRLVWRTATATTGLKVGLTCPASPTIFDGQVICPGQAADGTANIFAGSITSSGDSVSCAGAEAVTTDYEAIIYGTIVNGANAGNLQLQWAAEVGSAGAVTPRQGSSGRLWIP